MTRPRGAARAPDVMGRGTMTRGQVRLEREPKLDLIAAPLSLSLSFSLFLHRFRRSDTDLSRDSGSRHVFSSLLFSSPPPSASGAEGGDGAAYNTCKWKLLKKKNPPSSGRNTFLWCGRRRSRLGRADGRAGDDGICWTTRANCSGRFFTRIRSQDLRSRRKKKDDDEKEE